MAMIIAIPKERRADETRVAATPETVKKFKGLGLDVVVESDAGKSANFSDSDFSGGRRGHRPGPSRRAQERRHRAEGARA